MEIIFARVCSQNVFKMSTIAQTHAWRRFLHWSTAVSIMTCRKSDQFVKDSERTKSKMLVFCMVLIFALIFLTFGRHLLDR